MVTLTARRQRAEQLAHALDGAADVDELPAELRRLARLAATVRDESTLPVLTAAGNDRVRDRVLAELHLDAAEPAVDVRTRVARSPRVAVATGLASALIAASGVTVAAQEALPGDALYPIKQASESARLAVTGDPTELGLLELTLATERLSEVTAAAERGRSTPSALVGALDEMDRRTDTGLHTLAREASRSSAPDALVDEVVRWTQTQTAGLHALQDRLAPEVRGKLRGSLVSLTTLSEQLFAPLLAACDGCTAVATAGDAVAPEVRDSSPPVDSAASPDGDEVTTRAPSSEAGSGPARPPPRDATPSDPPTSRSPLPPLDTTTGDDRRVVPRLPEPLDGVGGAIDDTVGGVLDGVGGAVDDTVGGVLDGASDLVGELDDTVRDTVRDTGDAVGGLLGGLGSRGGSDDGR